MEKQPLVTVGIPTYNRPKGLEKCLNELVLQSYKNLEIIISDNCSSKIEVQNIGEKFQREDSRITYYRQYQNILGEPNFNFVFNKAKGDYFMWMADDDYFDKDYIEQCVSFLEENKDYIHASGITKYYNKQALIATEKVPDINSTNPYFRVWQYLISVRKNGIFYGVFRNNIAEINPIQNHIAADWSFIARQSFRGKLKVLETTSYHRSIDGESASRERMVGRWKFVGLKKIFFETYSAKIVSNSIFDVKSNYPFRLLNIFGIFVLLNIKFLINSFNKRFNKRYF